MVGLGTIWRKMQTRQGRREVAGSLVFHALGRVLNAGRSMFLVGYRPDFDHDNGAFPEYAQLRTHWIRGNVTNNLGDVSRLYLLALNAAQVIAEKVPGNFAELGVYKGNSAKVLHEYSGPAGRTLYLFDTFSGFDASQTAGLDREVAGAFRDTGLDAVRAFVGSEQVVYVPGLFPDSLRGMPEPGAFALVHIDCDLYEPMKAGLDYFYPRTSPGGVLILHDYGSGHWPGIRRAVDAFLDDKPERPVLMPDKSGTAVLRKCHRR